MIDIAQVRTLDLEHGLKRREIDALDRSTTTPCLIRKQFVWDVSRMLTFAAASVSYVSQA